MKNKPMKPKGRIHHTRGVYNNGEYKDNGVHSHFLDQHIQYNTTMRFGRALFVDGWCVHKGYLDDKRIAEIERQLKKKPVVMDRDTQPYH